MIVELGVGLLAIGTLGYAIYWQRERMKWARLKMVLEGKKEVLRLKKEAAVKYFKNCSIARGTYDELVRKYEERMAELEEKERALRARMKKKVKKKGKERKKKPG